MADQCATSPTPQKRQRKSEEPIGVVGVVDNARTKLPPTTTTTTKLIGVDIPRRKRSDLIKSSDELFDLFDKYQVLHLSKSPDTVERETNDFTWKDIQQLFQELHM